MTGIESSMTSSEDVEKSRTYAGAVNRSRKAYCRIGMVSRQVYSWRVWRYGRRVNLSLSIPDSGDFDGAQRRELGTARIRPLDVLFRHGKDTILAAREQGRAIATGPGDVALRIEKLAELGLLCGGKSG